MARVGDEDRIKHAADDPTAMWDEDSVRESGLDEALKKKPAPVAAPATATAPKPAAQPVAPAPSATAPTGISWVAMLALAAAVGVIVFLVVRMLR